MSWLLWIAGGAVIFSGGYALTLSGTARGRSEYAMVASKLAIAGWLLILLGALLWRAA